MKYKHCPDCGAPISQCSSDDHWVEYYDCPKCELLIRITHGETMHAEPDKETWTRKPSEPRKPREWKILVDENNNALADHRGLFNSYPREVVRVREVLE